MKLNQSITTLKKKILTRQELYKLCQANSDENLYEQISECVSAGILEPVATSGTNGNRNFPLYAKYRIVKSKTDHTEIIAEIRNLYPTLWSNGYLINKPEEFEKYASEIRMLSIYLFKNCKSQVSISRKERSFEIFSEEKKLDDKTFFGLLSRMGLSKDCLYFYDTPERCFSDYIPHRKKRMTLLICENKDIWFNIRRVMYEEDKFELFGVQFNGVIYGQGNMITESNALTDYTEFLHADEVFYYYWGDIDKAGFDIYLRLIKENSKLSIVLFSPAYNKMLELSINRILPKSDDNRGININIKYVFDEISELYKERFADIIEQNFRLPQEIISYSFLHDMMR